MYIKFRVLLFCVPVLLAFLQIFHYKERIKRVPFINLFCTISTNILLQSSCIAEICKPMNLRARVISVIKGTDKIIINAYLEKIDCL